MLRLVDRGRVAAVDAGGVVAALPSASVPRFTLTAFGDRIYARLGPPFTNVPLGMGLPRVTTQSKIVAVDRSTEGKVLWSKLASDVNIPKRPADATNRIGFEGTPVADGRNLYDPAELRALGFEYNGIGR